jgi:2-keto-4-pentenoate hydratase/2-oxohepta-3-ene-1,7-dioic acid hydratase in catechol pathway
VAVGGKSSGADEYRRFLSPADVVELEVDGIGSLRNRFVGAPE